MRTCQLQQYLRLESGDYTSKNNFINLKLVHEIFRFALNFLIISFLSEIFSRLGTYLFQNSRVTVMSINKDKLAKRQEIKEHNPDFIRPESWRYVRLDRKSTRLNSSHKPNSYAVSCLKKKKQATTDLKSTRLNSSHW